MAKRKNTKTVKNIKIKVKETKMKQNEKPLTEARLMRGFKETIEKNNEPNEDKIGVELNDNKSKNVIDIKVKETRRIPHIADTENHCDSKKNLEKEPRSDRERIIIKVNNILDEDNFIEKVKSYDEEIKFNDISARKGLYPRTCPECLATYSAKYSFYKHKKFGRCQNNKSKLQKNISTNKNILKNKDAKNSNKEKITEKLENQTVKPINKTESYSQEKICEVSNKQTVKEEKESVSMPTHPLHCSESVSMPTHPLHCSESVSMPTDPLHCSESVSMPTDPLHCSESVSKPTHPVHCSESVSMSTHPLQCSESVSMPTHPLHCSICNHSYKTKTTYEKHFLKCKDRKPRYCPNCEKLLKTDKIYYSHMKGCNRSKDLAMLSSLSEGNHIGLFYLFPSIKSPDKILDTSFFQCYHCSTMYFSRPTFISHLKKQICGNMKKRISCTYEDCNIKFSRYEHLLLHLPSYHNDTSYLNKNKYFPSYTLFDEWKANEQNETFSYLVKSRGSKIYKSNEYSYYECQFNATSDKKQGPKRKTERRKKAGLIPYLFCPARMSVLRNIPTGIVCVNYIEKHSHELSLENFKYQRFPRSVVNHILAELKRGVTPLQVLEYYQRDIMVSNSNTVNESDIKMNHLITLRFIKYLQKKLSSKEKHFMENTEGSHDGDVEFYEVILCDNNEDYKIIPIHKKKPDKILYIDCDDEKYIDYNSCSNAEGFIEVLPISTLQSGNNQNINKL